ncbi:MAG: hypothetical protein Salg2KO_05370 [Salibacteraceae bacterium]
MYRFNLIVCILLCTYSFYGQRTQLLSFDYSRADSIALNFPRNRYKSIEEFTTALTQKVDTDHEKFRVIFRWITNNIDYRIGRSYDDVEDVLKKKKGDGAAFASLLEAMAHSAELRCETIHGYEKVNPFTDLPKNMKAPDHAWNAVFLAGQWHLTDVSWAAGTIEPKRRRFNKGFRELWYLPDANFFIHTHYPESERWMFHDIDYGKRQFKREPIFLFGSNHLGIKLAKNSKGTVRKRLKVEFKSESDVEWATIQFHGDEDAYNVLLRKFKTTYRINYSLDPEKDGPFTLFLNGKECFTYLKK